jgi:GntR family transcriptional regulator
VTTTTTPLEQRFVPRYFEIEQSLRARLVALQPGDPFPSDADLCKEFGVSRMTARHAIERLKAEGLVVRRPGHGTFVAERATHRQAGRLLSFSEEMRRLGVVPRSVVLERRLRPAGEQESRRLALPEAEPVFALERVRIGGDEPVAVETAVLRAECAALLEEAELERGSLHEALVRGGLVPTAGRGWLRAEAAGARDARLLGLRRGAPLLVERRLIVDQRRRPLELGETRYAADRYSLEIEFGVEIASRKRR